MEIKVNEKFSCQGVDYICKKWKDNSHCTLACSFYNKYCESCMCPTEFGKCMHFEREDDQDVYFKVHAPKEELEIKDFTKKVLEKFGLNYQFIRIRITNVPCCEVNHFKVFVVKEEGIDSDILEEMTEMIRFKFNDFRVNIQKISQDYPYKGITFTLTKKVK